jgi:hypothetical protein
VKRGPTNLPASIHQRLLNRAKQEGRPLNELLQYFAMERFLFRLAQSPHAEEFLLKGALMLRIWNPALARPTMDIDLLARTAATEAAVVGMVKECLAPASPDDGLRFDAASLRADAIAADAIHQGLRLRFTAHLGHIPIAMQADVGFGDAVFPEPTWIDFPTLLDFPAPRLLAYPPESAVAEKFHAMVELDMANSRMKDFYDIWSLARLRDFDGSTLARALTETFARRRTPLPSDTPNALTSTFAEDATKQAQWNAFVRRGRLDAQGLRLTDVAASIRDFLMPPVLAAAAGQAFEEIWPASGPWRPPPPRAGL